MYGRPSVNDEPLECSALGRTWAQWGRTREVVESEFRGGAAAQLHVVNSQTAHKWHVAQLNALHSVHTIGIPCLQYSNLPIRS